MAKRRRSCTVMQRVVLQQGAALYCVILTPLQPFFHGRFNDFRAGLLTASVWTACAPVAHICAATGLTPATSAPGLIFQGSLRLSARERNRSACVLGSSAQVRVLQSSVDRHTVGLGAGLPPQVGTPLAPAPRQGSPLPHMHEIWAHPCHICTRSGLTYATRRLGAGVPRKARTAANQLYDCVHGQYATSSANRTGVFY
jgi:hypothetical protein